MKLSEAKQRRFVDEGQKAHGFACEAVTEVPEIEGVAYKMRHELSGARLLYLANDDADKAFSITFKTPAADDTGVFHILEHSVLCGSREFPVKEPFVNLLKSSMQTFLNAMTFPDKTMYPVASTNEQDLMNLMHVYLDAVFFPRIYSTETIFRQEGWRYELEDESLAYNGVVFNEMKGALSDPLSILYDTMSAAMFPDTTYRFESGGLPSAIPTLSYESYLDSHRRHYTPENSYIVLYGDLDAQRFLRFIDERYLSPIASSKRESDAGAPNQIDMQEPVRNMGVRRKMATSPENSAAAFGYMAGVASDRERIVAVDLLLDALMGSNASPLKRALLDADIAEDVSAFVADSIAQPFAMIQAKGLHEGGIERMGQVIERVMREQAEGGLDRELLRAALTHMEFVLREGEFGYSDGVVYSMSAMAGWLYDDDAYLDYICYEDVIESLRQKIEQGYFEQICREVFLENDHAAQVEIVPVDSAEDAWEAKALNDAWEQMSSGTLEEIAHMSELLQKEQSTPDSPENLAKLPVLSLEDIGEPKQEPAVTRDARQGISVLDHHIETHGIFYVYRYYSLDSVSFDDLGYVTLLLKVLGRLDTESHSAREIDTLITGKLGNLGFSSEIHEGPAPDGKIRPFVVVSSSCLEGNAGTCASIEEEIIWTSDLSDPTKVRDVLLQMKVHMEQVFMNSGHKMSSLRASSGFSRAALLREKLGGIEFYKLLKDVLQRYDKDFQSLSAKLKSVRDAIFMAAPTLSFAGAPAAQEAYMDAWKEGIAKLKSGNQTKRLKIPKPIPRNEAFTVPTDVTYTSLCAPRASAGGASSEYSGEWLVASNVLSLDYLWNEVRVKGGAYGVSFSTTRPGNASFASYRDPNIDETVERYKHAGAWMQSFDCSPTEFDGYIISTVAPFDKPLKPRAMLRRQDLMEFSDYPYDEYIKHRQEAIGTTLEQMNALGARIADIASDGVLCTIGNEEAIKASNIPYEVAKLV